LILMNSSGRIYLQKRSKIKSENAWLYDKSVGGHVVSWDSFDLTLIKECAEELWLPATLMNNSDFKKAISSTDLSIIWIFRKIEYINTFNSIRINNDWSQIIQPHMTNIYVWYYDWAIKFVDWECSGIEVFSLEDLKNEIKNTPNKFTEDLKYMIDKYSDVLVPINI
jgi:isopentenyldiphosphate isomerase